MTELKEKGYIYDRNNIEIYKEFWKPQINETYWYITSCGAITDTFYTGDDADVDVYEKQRVNIGNCFQTREEAREAQEAFFKWFKTYRRCQ